MDWCFFRVLGGKCRDIWAVIPIIIIQGLADRLHHRSGLNHNFLPSQTMPLRLYVLVEDFHLFLQFLCPRPIFRLDAPYGRLPGQISPRLQDCPVPLFQPAALQDDRGHLILFPGKIPALPYRLRFFLPLKPIGHHRRFLDAENGSPVRFHPIINPAGHPGMKKRKIHIRKHMPLFQPFNRKTGFIGSCASRNPGDGRHKR